MKTVLLAAFFFCSTNIFAQTTQEEYNYVTKGYIQTVNAGLDAKQGYYVENLSTINDAKEATRFTVAGLYKSDTRKLRALMYLLYVHDKLIKVLCYPLAGSPQYLYDSFYSDLQLLTTFQKNMLVQSLGGGYSKELSKH